MPPYITVIIKALRFLWPFVAEMFFAGKSFKQIVLENKLIAFLLLLLIGSILLNYLSFSKIYEIALARREDDGPHEVRRNKAPEKPVATQPLPPKPSPASSATEDESHQDPHERVRQRLQEIYGGHPK